MSETPIADSAAGDAAVAPDGDPTTYEVVELIGGLAQAVEAALPDEIWIRGQIRNLGKSRKGHVYFDLATPGPAEKPPEAVLPVVLFDWYRRIVNRILGPGASGQMVDGAEVRIRGAVSIYKARGQLQLQMRAIDPAYTLSRLADQRDRLLGELSAAGLLERNKARPLPTVPLRVGLVTSANSAAEADFRHVLTVGGIGWEILLADTPVQGFGSEQRIAEALARAGRHGAEVIALVRGGGARTELAPFDSAAVAQAVAACPVPVVTGIGHEIDRSVADIVAHTACNTPTAAASFLRERVESFDRAVLAVWRHIERAAGGALAGRRRRLDGERRRIIDAAEVAGGGALAELQALTAGIAAAARHDTERAGWRLDLLEGSARDRAAGHLAGHREQLVALAGHLRRCCASLVGGERRRLDALGAQVRAYDPQRALERGWSITTDAGGRLIRSVREVSPGASLQTRVRDGAVTSSVLEVTPATSTGSDHGRDDGRDDGSDHG